MDKNINKNEIHIDTGTKGQKNVNKQKIQFKGNNDVYHTTNNNNYFFQSDKIIILSPLKETTNDIKVIREKSEKIEKLLNELSSQIANIFITLDKILKIIKIKK